jgi:hypothetical protein
VTTDVDRDDVHPGGGEGDLLDRSFEYITRSGMTYGLEVER